MPTSSKATSNSIRILAVGRASLDVDSFKRLILTGRADPTVSGNSATLAGPVGPNHGLAGDGSVTDTSSISRQSLFENMPDGQLDTPRTSYEISLSEDERQLLDKPAPVSGGRPKPLPPVTRHGKSLTTKTPGIALENPQTGLTSGSNAPDIINRAPSSTLHVVTTNLNKPLPDTPLLVAPEPSSRSYESSGTDDITRSTPATPGRKIPPEPPLSRRHSQLGPSKRDEPRSGSTRTFPVVKRATSDSPSGASKMPTFAPAPPVRRISHDKRSQTLQDHRRSVPTSSDHPTPEWSNSHSGLGTPKSAGGTVTAPMTFTSQRPALTDRRPTSSRSSIGAPPPPPPRRSRGLSHTSQDRQLASPTSPATTIIDGVNSDTAADISNLAPKLESAAAEEDMMKPTNTHDVMAEITALQQEVDEFRGKYERRTVRQALKADGSH